ncbi:MAG: 50S ribosomal protein L13 [Candidatus Hodarchaeales archaeon]|jgi:large subunit ribosomal protein L13
MVVIDAEKMILGRLASEIASFLLRETDDVFIVNAEKCLVTGNPRYVVEKYRQRAAKRTATNPKRGPFFPRSPTLIVRRTVRGMLPWKQARGKEAYRRLKVFIGVPEEIKKTGEDFVKFDSADGSKLRRRCLTVGEIASRIGPYRPFEKK